MQELEGKGVIVWGSRVGVPEGQAVPRVSSGAGHSRAAVLSTMEMYIRTTDVVRSVVSALSATLAVLKKSVFFSLLYRMNQPVYSPP